MSLKVLFETHEFYEIRSIREKENVKMTSTNFAFWSFVKTFDLDYNITNSQILNY